MGKSCWILQQNIIFKPGSIGKRAETKGRYQKKPDKAVQK